MTVKELVEILQQFPEEMTIVEYSGFDDGTFAEIMIPQKESRVHRFDSSEYRRCQKHGCVGCKFDAPIVEVVVI